MSERLTGKEVDELMRKRKFTLGAHTGSGLRMYTYTDIEKTPRVLVEIIPERQEFRISYQHIQSINRIETPWCSPITNKEHFKKILKGVIKWARLIEDYYEENEECMQP